jgi:hypothetical protein
MSSFYVQNCANLFVLRDKFDVLNEALASVHWFVANEAGEFLGVLFIAEKGEGKCGFLEFVLRSQFVGFWHLLRL